ncbi:MAG: DUF805 domain-containing protein, partial [Actinomycetes bacterium]
VTGCAAGPAIDGAGVHQGATVPAQQAGVLPVANQQSSMPTKSELQAARVHPFHQQPNSDGSADASTTNGPRWGKTTGKVGFGGAIADGFRRAFDFKGRSSRSAYWWWSLMFFISYMGAVLIDVNDTSGQSSLSTIVGTLLLIPGLAVSVRRLHDIGRSGWWMLLLLLSFIGFIVLFIWHAQRSHATNQYGVSPDEIGSGMGVSPSV